MLLIVAFVFALAWLISLTALNVTFVGVHLLLAFAVGAVLIHVAGDRRAIV